MLCLYVAIDERKKNDATVHHSIIHSFFGITRYG